MKLYEIDKTILNCMMIDEETAVNTETGEVINVEALRALEMEREKKIENIGCWIKNLEADEKSLAAEEKAFAERKKAAKNKAESLKRFLSEYLAGEKFETAKVKISYRSSESIEVDEEVQDIPEEYLRYKAPELDKTAVKKAIKAGKTVPGCQLVKKQNIQIK